MHSSLTIIGCGRLGKTLAFLWKKAGLVSIQDIYNSNIINAENAAAFIGEGTACASMTQFKSADMYLIATPDDRIEVLCQQLVEQASPKTGSLVFHCSGLHASECLNAVKPLGCYTASVHPVFSFSNPVCDVKDFADTYCSFEGDIEVLEQISSLITGIGGQLFLLEKGSKALYHAASVFASNYLVTLFTIAEDCYKKAGLPDNLAKILVHRLMEQSLNRIKSLELSQKALTGPIQRGDSHTLKKHLEELEPFADLQHLYKILGKATVLLAEDRNEKRQYLSNIFII
jgi:predicted short-subunit dehydrogenase-like oxidoreductase (DUF2520 family)